MKDFGERMKDIGSQVRLSENEKAEGKRELLSYMTHGRRHPPRSWTGIRRFIVIPATAASLFLLITGGLIYTAQDTIPGDLLYPVKRSITEPLTAVLTPDGPQTAVLHAQLAQRRLEEAEQLIASGVRNTSSYEILTRNFEHHAQKVTQTVTANATNETAQEVNADFESLLQSHQQILKHLATTQGTTTPELKPLFERIAAREKASESLRIRRTSFTATSSTSTLRSNIQQNIDHAHDVTRAVRSLLEEKRSMLPPGATRTIEKRLTMARDTISAAQHAFDKTHHKKSHMLADIAEQLAEEAHHLIEAQQKLSVPLSIQAPQNATATLHVTFNTGTSTQPQLKATPHSAASSTPPSSGSGHKSPTN